MAGVCIRALYEEGKSLPEIERLTGIPRSTIRHRLIGDGVALRPRVAALRNAAGLGSGRRGKSFPMSDSAKANVSAARRAWANDNAKGTSLKASGYVAITRGENKHRGEHVVIMEARLGRHLKPDEVVHHIDGNRSNNHPDNLALMTRAAHMRLHMRERRLSKGIAA
jgi:hypothetical protein